MIHVFEPTNGVRRPRSIAYFALAVNSIESTGLIRQKIDFEFSNKPRRRSGRLTRHDGWGERGATVKGSKRMSRLYCTDP